MKWIKLGYLKLMGYNVERGCGARWLTTEPWVVRDGEYYRIFRWGTPRYTTELKTLLRAQRSLL